MNGLPYLVRKGVGVMPETTDKPQPGQAPGKMPTYEEAPEIYDYYDFRNKPLDEATIAHDRETIDRALQGAKGKQAVSRDVKE